MQFEWDEAKSQRNIRERGFGFRFASLIFRGHVVEEADESMDYGEDRIGAIGLAEGRLLFVVYTDRGDVRRIISARRATPRERAIWDTGQ